MTSDRSNGSESTEVAPSAAVPVKTLNPNANEFHSVNPQPAAAAVVVPSSPESSTLLQVVASSNDEPVEPGATAAEPHTPDAGVQGANMVLPDTPQGDANMDHLEGAVGYAPGYEPTWNEVAYGYDNAYYAYPNQYGFYGATGGNAQYFPEYTFVNGDAGDRTVFPPTPESDVSLPTAAVPDYSGMNGAASAMEPQPVYDPVQQQAAAAVEDIGATAAGGAGSGGAAAVDMDEAALNEQLQHQLEYYFSPQNLAVDTYLCSQMDEDKFVSISVVASFPKVTSLTHDLEKVVAALRASALVQVDDAGEKVRALNKRCVVILREIPDSTPREEVVRLFSHPDCPAYSSLEHVVLGNWYITFESEEDAQQAYAYLRETAKEFLGRPIMARIKAKPLVQNAYPKNGFKGQPSPQTPPMPAGFEQQQPPQIWFSSSSIPTVPLPTPHLAPITKHQAQHSATVVTSTYPHHTPIVSAPPPTAISVHHPQAPPAAYCPQPGAGGALPFFPPSQPVPATHVWQPGTIVFDPGAFYNAPNSFYYPYPQYPVFAANGYTPSNYRIHNGSGKQHHQPQAYHNVRQVQQRQDSRHRRYNQQQVSTNQSGGSSHHHPHHHGGSSLGGSHRDQHHHHHHHPHYDGPHRGPSHRAPRHRGGGGGGGGGNSSASSSAAAVSASAASSTEPSAQPSAAPANTSNRATGSVSSSAAASANSAPSSSSISSSVAATVTPSSMPATTSSSSDNCYSRLNSSSASANSSAAAASIESNNTKDSAQPQRSSRSFRNGRNRRRGPDDDGAKRGPGQSGGQQGEGRSAQNRQDSSATAPPPRETFELEDTSFPPLPGATSNNSTNEVFENKMSDVVKGKAKPLTREPKVSSTVATTSSSASPVSTSQVTSTTETSASPPRSPHPPTATQQTQKAGKSPSPELPWSKPPQLTTPSSSSQPAPTQATPAAAAAVEKSTQSTSQNAQTPKSSSQPAADNTDTAMDTTVSTTTTTTTTTAAATEQQQQQQAPQQKMSYALIVAKPKEPAGDNNTSADNNKKQAEENNTEAPSVPPNAAAAAEPPAPSHKPRDNPHHNHRRNRGGGRGGKPMYHNGPRRPGPGPPRDGPPSANGSRK